MKRIRIAQIGMGHDHATATYATILKLSELYEFVGLYEPSPEYDGKAPADIKRVTLEELLAMEDLDAVAVECEELLATHYAQTFAARGVHIHMDKPGSPDLSAFSALVNTVKEKGVTLHLGYMYRYNPVITELLSDIKAGKYGEIFSVEAQMSVRHPDEKRAWLSRFPGGMLYFLGCHIIDLVMQIQGVPSEVIPLSTKTEIGGVDAEDLGFAVLKYPRGLSFVKSCATEHNGFARRNLVVCGSLGTVELSPLEEHMGGPIRTRGRVTHAENVENIWYDQSTPIESAQFDRYEAMMRAFAAYVNGKENPNTPDYEQKLFETVMKCCGV